MDEDGVAVQGGAESGRERGKVMTSEQVKEATGYLHRAINAGVFGVPAEEVPPLHERLDNLLHHIEAQEAEIERLREALTVNLSLASEQGNGLMLGHVMERLAAALEKGDEEPLSPEALVDEACTKIADLASIRSALSILGDGEPVELAKRAAKVIEELASNGSNILCPYHKIVNCNACPGRPYRSTNCNTTRIEAAIDAAKGGSNG